MVVRDRSNKEFNNALELILRTNSPLIYLTGKAGTGKTTFLKTVRSYSRKNMVILAPTGVAAVNAGGQTIHSFFGIAVGPYVPGDSRLDSNNIRNTFRYNNEKLNLIRELELVIIDEVSMVRCDILDVIDRILRYFRKNDLAFGGVQMLLIGDAFQLPPINTPEEWSVLGRFYSGPFFFNSKVMEENKGLYIELKKIYRQKEQSFIDLLNKVRVNEMTEEDFRLLNSKYNPYFQPSEGEQYIILATTNAIVDEYNESKLNALQGEPFYCGGEIKGTFPDSNLPTDEILRLKVGAQVIFRKNKIPQYYNGSLGTVVDIGPNCITVEIKGKKNEKSIQVIERETWQNIAYTWNDKIKKVEEEIVGTFTQFPIKLAWAITVHKSQGLTFDRVIADVGSAFAPGQVYVALSRCTSFNGLVLKSLIHQDAIKTDMRIVKFAENETPHTLLFNALTEGRAAFLYEKSRKFFLRGKFQQGFNCFWKATKCKYGSKTGLSSHFAEP